MNEPEKETSYQPARKLAEGFGGSGIPEADFRRGGNAARQADAEIQGTRDKNWTCKEEVALPVLAEMGDISPALELLLRVQADYARREPGVTRAMRDVAYNAVGTEIERYLQRASRQFQRG